MPLPRGTHGFDDTRYMWDTGHFKTILDLGEYGRRVATPYDPSKQEWRGEQTKILALDDETGRCRNKPVE